MYAAPFFVVLVVDDLVVQFGKQQIAYHYVLAHVGSVVVVERGEEVVKRSHPTVTYEGGLSFKRRVKAVHEVLYHCGVFGFNRFGQVEQIVLAREQTEVSGVEEHVDDVLVRAE